MGKTWKLVFTGAATIAALSTGSVLYAHTDKPQSGAGTMQGSGEMKGMMDTSGDMKGMMNMMGQMNQMMKGCNKMMQDMTAPKSTDKPADKPSSEKSK